MKFLTDNTIFLYKTNYRIIEILAILPLVVLCLAAVLVVLQITAIYSGPNPADGHIWTLLYTIFVEFGQVFVLCTFSTVVINFKNHTHSEKLFRNLIIIKLIVACLLSLDVYGALDPLIFLIIFLAQAISFGVIGLMLRKRLRIDSVKLNGLETWLRSIYLIRAILAFTIILSVLLPLIHALEGLIIFIILRKSEKEIFA